MLLKTASKFHHQICVIVIIAICIVMFLHFIDLTIFASTYSFNFNYGSSLRGLCSNEYFEYETGRFQVASNADNIRISSENEKKYIMIIFIICIMVSLWVSIIFAGFVYNLMTIIEKASPNWITIPLSILKWILCLSVALWIVVYLSLIFTTKNNQSPFSKKPYNSYILS